MQINKIILFLFTLAIFVGCSTQTLQVNSGGGTASFDKAQSFFFSGIWQEKEIDPVKICGNIDKVVKVQTETTFLNGFVSALTLGNLYTLCL